MVNQPEDVQVIKDNEGAYLEELQALLDLKSRAQARRVSIAVTTYLATFLRENPGYVLGFMPIKEGPRGTFVQDRGREVWFMRNAPLDRLLAFADPEPAEQVPIRRELIV